MQKFLWAGIFLVFVNIGQATEIEKIGPGVVEALQREGKANVFIALNKPAAIQATQGDLSTEKREIANLQDNVLFALQASEYRGRRKYLAIPAFSGELLSEAGLAKLAANPNVAKVDLDVGGAGSLAYSVAQIGADIRQTQGITGKGVVVAVLDTGLDTDHTDLADDLIHQECFLDFDGAINGVGRCPNGSDRQSGTGAAEDGIGHGTHVTGIITSKGVVSSAGVAPDAKIVSIKVLDDTPPFGTFQYFSEIVAALDFIINNRPDVKVVNMSLGTNTLFSENCDSATAFNIAAATAINTLRSKGVIAFASSGNNGSGTQMTSPACLSNVVSVAAVDNNDVIASFANTNTTTDILAPGVNITSNGLANGTNVISGTSQASPHAAGCAALLIQAGIATTPDEIEAFLKSSPVEVTDSKNSLMFPRIDCSPAVDVYLLVDLSDSVADHLPIFKTQAPEMISTLKASIPNIRFGVGSFEDYPISPFGDAGSGDVAYRQNIDLAFDIAAVKSVIGGLFTRFGGDAPQSQLPALFQAATGAGQDLSGVGLPGASIPPGQQANFRTADEKLFLLWTNTSFHQAGDPAIIPYPGPGFTETVDAILALDPPKVIGISSGGGGLADLEAITAATGALAPPEGVDCDGDGIMDLPGDKPLVCSMGFSGKGIAEAIVALVEGTSKPTARTVSVDIRPHSENNRINVKSRGVIPVAILSTDTFDATSVDPSSVKFGPAGATEAHRRGHVRDWDRDGDMDLMLHFKIQETGIQCGDTSASLTGRTFDDHAIEGSDFITTKGCK